MEISHHQNILSRRKSNHHNSKAYVFKEKKQARVKVKQVYPGRLLPQTGEFIPSKRVGEDKRAALEIWREVLALLGTT